MIRSDRRLARRRFFRPLLEQLEARRLLANITVTSVEDTIAVDGLVTLREAITSANNNAGVNADVVTLEPYGTAEPDTISFNIAGTGVHTIRVGETGLGALPTMTGPLIVDGYTQPGASVNTNSVESKLGLNAVLRIELDGTSAGVSAHGLTLGSGSDGSTLRGLVVNRFARAGVFLVLSNNHVLEGNLIGTDASGTMDRGNEAGGVLLELTSGNRIGGTNPAARNVISGNEQHGISGNVVFSSRVLGNLIGTDITGAQRLGNGHGVSIAATNTPSNDNVIGGTTAGSRNIISGNVFHGVVFESVNNSLNRNAIQGNYIGTDVTGTVAIGNARAGIALGQGVRTTMIGGDDLADGTLDGIVHARNVISGNQGTGISAGSASQTHILGNFIGTQADGLSPLGNGSLGIDFFVARPTQVGGTASGAGNVIAFNSPIGVRSHLSDMTIQGNSIFGNASHGVVVINSNGTPILGNAINGNGGLGIDLAGDGVTANDPGDTDGGEFVANNLQNFPVLLEVLSTAVDSTIFGTLNSLPQTDFLIQFFASDSADPSGHGEGQVFLGETVVHTNSAGNVTFSADVPALLTPGQQVTATATRLADHDADPGTPSVPTDTSEFSQAISGAASILQLDGPTIERDLPLGQEITFRLNVPPGTDARLTSHFADPQIGEILVRVGDLPDVNSFAERVVAFVNPDPEFLLVGMPTPYFIRVRGTSTAAVPLGHFSLTAQSLELGLDKVSPSRGSNVGQVTTTLFGSGFSAETVFSLVGQGTERAAANIVPQSETSFFATFDLVGLATGSYSVRAVDGARSTELVDAFTVTTGNPGRLEAQLLTSRRTLAGREAGLFVEYVNVGETDVPAPLLLVVSDNATVNVPRAPSGGNTGGGGGGTGGNSVRAVPFLPPAAPPPPFKFVAQFFATSTIGPAGVLPPGTHEVQEVRYRDDFSDAQPHPILHFRLILSGPDDLSFDLAAQKDDLRPPPVSPAAWDVIFKNLLTRFGTTVGGYLQALRDSATYLSQYGIYTTDLDRLLSLHIAQADNALPGGSPHSAVDAAAPASGVPLVWGRTFAPTISRRFDMGILGRGWTDPWDIRLSRVPDDGGTNDVLIRTPGGTRRFDESPFHKGLFGSSALDPARLTLDSGVFSLRETDGTISRFDEATGRLLDVTDRNGHKVTLNYDAAGLLVRLLHSNGDHFDFVYNAAGRLTQLTDQALRVTTYAYDLANEHLLSVTGPDGTIAYTYETTVGSQAEHALTSVTNPDGTHVFYEYDAQGRLGRTVRDGGAEAVTMAYGATGEVFITDALGNTSSLFFNEFGQLLEARDALDRSARLDYDEVHRLDRVSLPLDTVSLFDFDDNGNLIFAVKPDGHSLSFTYDTTFNLPTTIRDERNVPLRYTYDSQGNPTSISHADGTIEKFTPDADGNITRSINRRSQAIDYTYDDRGLVLRKDHADGTFEAFTYDDRGNRLTAKDESGTTTFDYDAADRLTKVTYPNGRFLEYTYDDAGRRIRLEDQTGFVVKYRYDAAGRIAELTDGLDARIVLYTYDLAGRLVREDNGNLTVTTYGFDDANQLISLVNHLPDGTVSSRFDYAYDALGRRTSVTTLEGLTTFGYDAIGQLTSVVLSNGRVIQYAYDAAGNRTAVIDNGAVTDYQSNTLNQYTRIGSFDRTYDADGNLIADEAGGKTYTYDDESRLVSWVDGVLSVGYEYDALGNRIAKIEGGVRTEYLVDPLGLTNVVAEYDSAGTLIARYVHGGFGLVSRHNAGGAAAFYDFDGTGSTVALTDAGASIVNSYSYLPFGEALSISETVANPFEFVGQFGVQRDANGLDFMRARYYSHDDGRFINEDPIGARGGINLYRYVRNDPASLIDPQGLNPFLRAASLLFKSIRLADEVAAVEKEYLRKVAIQERAKREAERIAFEEADTTVDVVLSTTSTGILSVNPLALFITLDSDSPLGFDLGELVLPLKPTLFLCELIVGGDCVNFLFGFPPPPGDDIDDANIDQVASFDPNDIIGPAGFGPENFLRADTSHFYTIRFENLAAATAPAQTVVVTQALDPDLDLSTFEFRSLGVGASVVPLPGGRSSFLFRYDLRPEKNLFLDVGGDLNFETGVITWTFTSLDPATLELPEDVEGDIGFLPPNQSPPAGEGFVTYFVRPKPALASGTRIDAQARIVFDLNAPIDTPAIFNTLDALPPSSSVQPLPTVIVADTYVVEWSGTDEPAGSGIAAYDLYVSVDGGPPSLLLTASDTSVSLGGEEGRSYAFFTVARDNVGHVEPFPAQPDATTVYFDASPWRNDVEPLDVNADLKISVLDIVPIINELNHPRVSDPVTRALPVPPPLELLPIRYLDTSGDVRVSPQDLVRIINHLNARANAGQPEGEAAAASAVFDPPEMEPEATARDDWFSTLALTAEPSPKTEEIVQPQLRRDARSLVAPVANARKASPKSAAKSGAAGGNRDPRSLLADADEHGRDELESLLDIISIDLNSRGLNSVLAVRRLRAGCMA